MFMIVATGVGVGFTILSALLCGASFTFMVVKFEYYGM